MSRLSHFVQINARLEQERESNDVFNWITERQAIILNADSEHEILCSIDDGLGNQRVKWCVFFEFKCLRFAPEDKVK